MVFSFASPGDETRIKDLLNSCGLPYQDIDALNLSHFLVLQDEAGLAGVIGLEPFGRDALLRSLAVRAGDRNRRLASQLVTGAEEYARSLGVRDLYLLTMTAADLFTRRGYENISRDSAPALIQETTEFRGLCPVSSVCMVRHL